MLRFAQEDPSTPAMAAMIRAHRRGLKQLAPTSPPQSRHALTLDELKAPEVTLWGLWDGDGLVGCVALKEIDQDHGEIKSMRTVPGHLRRGLGSFMLDKVIEEARQRGYRRLSLETGSQPGFAPARQFYARHGFTPCAPFDAYVEDPNSVYMTLAVVDDVPGDEPQEASR